MIENGIPPLEVLAQMLSGGNDPAAPAPLAPPPAVPAPATAPAPAPAVPAVAGPQLPQFTPLPNAEIPKLRDPNEAYNGWVDRAAQMVHSFAGALDPNAFRRTTDRRGAMFIKGLADAWAGDRLSRVAGRQQKIEGENQVATSTAAARNAANIGLWSKQNELALSEPYDVRREQRALSNDEQRARTLAAIEMGNVEPRLAAEIRAGLKNGTMMKVPGYGVVNTSEVYSLAQSRNMQAAALEAQRYAQMFDLIPADIQSQIAAARQEAQRLRIAASNPALAGSDPASVKERTRLSNEAAQWEAVANTKLENLKPAVYAKIAMAPQQYQHMLTLYADPMLSMDDGGLSYAQLIQSPAYSTDTFERLGFNAQKTSLQQFIDLANASSDKQTKLAAKVRLTQIITDPRYKPLADDLALKSAVQKFFTDSTPKDDSPAPPPSYAPPPPSMTPRPSDHPVNASGADVGVRFNADTLSLDSLNTLIGGTTWQ